jgi:crossover junction endodeoxyribonuclease RuvC
MRVLGLDPGLHGALAVFDNDARFLDVLDVPLSGEGSKCRVNPNQIWPWLDKLRPDHAFLELVTAMPSIASPETGVRRGMGSASAFRFGDTVGTLRTVVQLCGIPFVQVVPVKWKRYHGLSGSDKEQSRQKAIDLLPWHSEFFKLHKHEARAEASLIAMYGWHEMRKAT